MAPSSDRVDVDLVIVGGGIAGSALATVMARRGARVLLLERERRYRDHIRGEILWQWGLAEARRLGLEDVLLAAGGLIVPRFVFFDEGAPPAPEDLGDAVAGIPGSLNLAHPVACEALIDAAVACRRGRSSGCDGHSDLGGSRSGRSLVDRRARGDRELAAAGRRRRQALDRPTAGRHRPRHRCAGQLHRRAVRRGPRRASIAREPDGARGRPPLLRVPATKRPRPPVPDVPRRATASPRRRRICRTLPLAGVARVRPGCRTLDGRPGGGTVRDVHVLRRTSGARER